MTNNISRQSSRQIDVLIIGAGAAGLMCAIEAGKRKKKVFVIDHENKPGKKILMSGGGRCNFTNTNTSSENFISHNLDFCKSALARYTPNHFISLVEKHGIPYHEKTLGQLFCDNKSKDILDMLLTECESAGVTIQLNTSIKEILKTDEGNFIVHVERDSFLTKSLVIATGGLSIPTMGASPFAYKVAEQFGISVWPTRAGLVPLTLHDKDKALYQELSGIAVDCSVSTQEKTFDEAILFTHRGLSGPAVLQISSYWKAGEYLTINLLPTLHLLEDLLLTKKNQPNMFVKNYLHQCLPKKLVDVFSKDLALDQPFQSFTNTQLEKIATQFQDWQIQPNGTEGYRTAEVTLGGIDCDAISSKTFEAKGTPGLYFIGEALDVTGWLGGYNFQWAWSSGFVAGNFV